VMWLDGSRYIANDYLYENISTAMQGQDMLFFHHSCKLNLDSEVEEAMRVPRYAEQGVRAQYQKYVDAGFPASDVDVLETSALVYRPKSAASWLVLESWWKHILLYSFEDQVSLPFVLWEYHSVINFSVMPRQTIMHMIGPRHAFEPHDLGRSAWF